MDNRRTSTTPIAIVRLRASISPEPTKNQDVGGRNESKPSLESNYSPLPGTPGGAYPGSGCLVPLTRRNAEAFFLGVRLTNSARNRGVCKTHEQAPCQLPKFYRIRGLSAKQSTTCWGPEPSLYLPFLGAGGGRCPTVFPGFCCAYFLVTNLPVRAL